MRTDAHATSVALSDSIKTFILDQAPDHLTISQQILRLDIMLALYRARRPLAD